LQQAANNTLLLLATYHYTKIVDIQEDRAIAADLAGGW
jgi:hypothetical protein